jgi:hypothetical protein
METGAFAAFVGGFVAAEGTFFVTRRTERLKVFTFAVGLGATDAETCELLHTFFGCGSIVRSARRQAHYDDEVRFQVRRRADLVTRVVPFMDEHLPPSYKRTQYAVWRSELIAYHERGRSP